MKSMSLFYSSKMLLFPLSVTCLINIWVSMYSVIRVHQWLADTGLNFIASQLLFIPAIIAFAFTLVLCFACFYIVWNDPKIMYVVYATGILGTIISIFFGAKLVLQPTVFFVGYTNVWAKYINTPRTFYVQERLRCCGYNRVKEFSADTCSASTSSPCLKRIIKDYASSIQIGGIGLFAHGISFGMAIFFAIINPYIVPVPATEAPINLPEI